MSPEAVSPLRRRMIEDMTIRQFGEHTQRAYNRLDVIGAALARDALDEADDCRLRGTVVPGR